MFSLYAGSQSISYATTLNDTIPNNLLMYHRFGKSKYPSTNTTTEQVEQHLSYLKDKNFNFIGILKHKLNLNEQKNHNLFNDSFFIENIKVKLSQKVSQNVLESLQNIKLFPIFVSKNLYNPPKNIFFVGDAFFAFSPSFAQGASQSIEGANELYECLKNNYNFYDIRSKSVKMINSRSNFNQFAFHLSNPLTTLLRNIFLKRLVKNKKFLESYLGKIYKN